ncbi:MAG: protein kinase, partial [Planctomycetales bacterium]|nr:protein kinase [Planctomycetales bacterium]
MSMSPSTDRNLLVGILALQMDFVSRDQLLAAMNAWLLLKSQPLEQILFDNQALSADTMALLQALVTKHLELHGNDARKSLQSLSSIGELRGELQSLSDPDIYATVAHIGSPPLAADSELDHLETQIDGICDAFVRAWRDGERPRIEDYLDQVSDSGCEGLLQALVREEVRLRMQAGDSASTQEYFLRFPGHPEAIELAFATQQRYPLRNIQRVSSFGSDAAIRFRVIRPHAKGGLGEVLVARDTELNREVALKQIQTQLAHDTDSRSRFVLEAEITGGLEHPGIVPVYGLGQYADGRPFYAMRFIQGDSLKEALDRFYRPDKLDTDDEKSSSSGTSAVRLAASAFSSLEFRKLLGRFVDVCQAISYAHSRGVLHRDLKPGNIMLGKYGETLVVDWGLAKVRGRGDSQSSSEETTLRPASGSGVAPTMMGSAIGTPAYMPPEQAAGRHDELGPASDVYSLGATLYHLLAGRAPFTARDLATVIQDVQHGRFPPPRSLQPDVPRPLEAVCLKSMALKPTERYGSPQELSDDIEKFLADEPVSAWPEPFTIRARRWVKRNQTFVTATAAAVLMAVVTLSVMFVVVTGQNEQLADLNRDLSDSITRETTARETAETNAELARQNEQRAIAGEQLAKQNEARAVAGEQDAREQRDAATTARQLAENNATAATEQSQLALSTLNAVIFDIQRSLEDIPGGASVRNRLLVSVLPQLEKVSNQFASKSAIDRNTMAALTYLADTVLQLGTVGQASSRSFVGPASSQPGTSSDDAAVAAVDLGRSAAAPTPESRSAALTAERLYQRAHEIAKQLAATYPNETTAQHDLSISFIKLGDVFRKLGRNAEALTQYEDGLKIRRELAEADPSYAEKQRDLSLSFDRIGDVFLALGRTAEALTQCQAALKISWELAEADPSNAEKQADLSHSLDRLGNVLLSLGRTGEALTQYENALKIRRVLADADPSDAQLQRDLSVSFGNLGYV